MTSSRTKKIRLASVVGARPNFMKVAPLYREFKKHNVFQHHIVHTGQHYSDNMSKVFFKDLGIPQPKINLNVGSGSHAEQTAKIMVGFEKVLLDKKIDAVLVVGDVNSTIACGLVAKKLGLPLFHVEAGLRSFDEKMPEEINRRLTDSISDLLFTTERSANVNLRREGASPQKIHFVGNVMIDSLVYVLKNKKVKAPYIFDSPYGLVTLHRPSNVDEKKQLSTLIGLLNKVASKTKLLFPMHPRTESRLVQFKLKEKLNPNIKCCSPLTYIEFLSQIRGSQFILTDSGGVQEEASVLNVPCLTLRENTERPVTVTKGTNYLIQNPIKEMIPVLEKVLQGKGKKYKRIELWDGSSARRIHKVLSAYFSN